MYKINPKKGTSKLLFLLIFLLTLVVAPIQQKVDGTKSSQKNNEAAAIVSWGSFDYDLRDVPAGRDFIAIDAGTYHSVALREDGSLAAWGWNHYGQTFVPAGKIFAAVAAGSNHNIALKTDGSLVGWGHNNFHQTIVPAGNDYIAVAAGANHSLALKSDGSLTAWGSNSYGQRNIPTGNDFTAIAAGGFHNLAIKEDGSLVAWGYDYYGQLVVPEGNNFVAIAAGDFHSLALRADGSLVAWGYDNDGQTTVPSGNDFVAIGAGEYHNLAIRADGSLEAWGTSTEGQTDVPAGVGYTAVAGGSNHSVALRLRPDVNPEGGHFGLLTVGETSASQTFTITNYHSYSMKLDTLFLTGINRDEFVITNDKASGTTLEPGESVYFDVAFSPSLVGEKTAEISIESDCLYGTITVLVKGTAFLPANLTAWGRNNLGQTDVPYGSDYAVAAAGFSHSLAIKADGSLVAWGDDTYGQLDVPVGSDYIAVAAGGYHSLALRKNGSLVAWGDDTFDHTDVPPGRDYIAVAAGGFHSLALRADGSLVAWGYNQSGQTSVPADSDFVAIAAGNNHSVALRSDGSLAAWGSNYYGQAAVPAGNDFAAVAAGSNHNVAIKSDGSLVSWGWNEYGQTDVPAGTDFIAVTCGSIHSVALRNDGSLAAWGWGSIGELEVPNSYSFVSVAAGGSFNVGLLTKPEITPLGYNFGPVEPGVSVRKTFTVTNPGLGDVIVGGLLIKGTYGAEFTIENDGVSHNKIKPGTSSTFDVIFSPAVVGEKTVILELENSAVNNNIIVKGTGIVPADPEAWGGNGYGQVDVPKDADFVAVAAGAYHSLALKGDGSLAAWGYNNFGETDVPAGSYVSIAAGEHFSVALKSDGSLEAWGRNHSGETNVPAGNDFVTVAAGAYFGVALRGDGSLAAWGWAGATDVPDGGDFVAVAAGGNHGLALKADGSLAAWGANTYGQADVPAGNDFVSVAAGMFHSTALKSDGSLVAWGWNDYGQTDVPAGSHFVAVAAGHYHNVAIKADGRMVGWGRDDFNQREVPGGIGFLSAAAGREHTVALRRRPDVNPEGKNLGSVVLGAASERQTFTITNHRSTELILGKPHLTGHDSAEFSIVNDHSSGVSIEPGGNAKFDVIFSPDSMGEKTGRITIETNRPDGDLTVLVKGTGVFPADLTAWGSISNAPEGSDFVAVSAGGSQSVALKADGSLIAWDGLSDAPEGSDFVAVSAGGTHNLALRADGSLAAWGSNSSGQTDVPEGAGFVSIAAGSNFSVALRADGSLAAWGNNSKGQTEVPLGTDFVAVAAGDSYGLALKYDGSLVGWGDNFAGQATVPEGTDFVAVAAGGWHSVALRADGSLSAWGSNNVGQTTVPDGTDFVAVGAGYYHSVALKADGRLMAWGWNNNGQADVPEGTGYIAVNAGYYHNVAMRAKFNISPTGYNFGPMELGSSASQTFTITNNSSSNLHVASLLISGFHAEAFSIENSSVSVISPGESASFDVVFVPVSVGEKTGVIDITSNHPDGEAALVLKGVGTESGSLEAWGQNNLGQTNVPAGSDYAAIAAGGNHSLVLKTDGSLAAWGFNSFQQSAVPVGADYVAVGAGTNHSMAIKEDGSLTAWGDNGYYQANAPEGSGFVGVAVGSYHNVALKGDGSLVAWGWNDYGQTDVPPGTGFVDIAAGFDHSVALKADGSLIAWGRNDKDQTDVPSGTDYVAVTAGAFFSVALKEDGSLTAWGDNQYGQTETPAGSDFVAVDAGGLHGLALRADGSVTAWGSNNAGQAVAPPGSGYAAISGGGSHSVALLAAPKPPLPPSGLTAEATVDYQVHLMWEAVEEADFYCIYRSEVSGSGYQLVDSPQHDPALATQSYLDTGVDRGSTYYYVVAAVNTLGLESEYSNEAFAAVPYSSEAGLAALTVNPGFLTPEFHRDTFAYEVAVDSEVESMDITATTMDENASITINGTAQVSGETRTIGLNLGVNTVTIEVTAEDGDTSRIYTMAVYRDEDLSGFWVEPAQPGGKTAGEAFDLDVTGARGTDGSFLEGDITVTVSSSLEGEVHNGAVLFTGGDATLSIVLSEVGVHTLTVAVAGVTESETLPVTVIGISEETGSLQVFLEPEEARSAGAQWRRNGTETWINSGDVEEDVPVGEHLIIFKAIDSWDMPAETMLVVTTDATTEYTATYTQKTYLIALSANPADAGTVDGGGTYVHGSSVTVTAIPGPGYKFLYWTEDGATVESNSSYTFMATADRTLVAHFEPLEEYLVSVLINPLAGGSVTGDGVYDHGSVATLQAYPAGGYFFVNWTENGLEVSSDMTYTFTADRGRELLANFDLYGDIDGSGQIDVGDAILVLRHIVGLIDIEVEFGPHALTRARVSGGEGSVDVGDAILILRYIVGLITEFPVEG